MSMRSFFSCASIASFCPFATESSFEPARDGALRQPAHTTALSRETHLRNPFPSRVHQKIRPNAETAPISPAAKRAGGGAAGERRAGERGKRAKGEQRKDKGDFVDRAQFWKLIETISRSFSRRPEPLATHLAPCTMLGGVVRVRTIVEAQFSSYHATFVLFQGLKILCSS